MKRKQRQPSDDYWEWFPFVCDITTQWCDTGEQLTVAEMDREMMPGATLERAVKITVRVPQGTETFEAPAGWNLYEADEVIFTAIECRLRRRKSTPLWPYEQMQEMYELMIAADMLARGQQMPNKYQLMPLGVEGKLTPRKLRAKATRKFATSKQFRRSLERIERQSQKSFREKSTLVRFILMNRYRWTTTKNPPRGKRSLRELSAREALDLMKAEGLPVNRGHYRNYCEWYRTLWKRFHASCDVDFGGEISELPRQKKRPLNTTRD